ncbi:MAG: dh protein [Ignavibacteria bacterium]|nr:dh protein [Ignavibacteria bacterium]
MTPIEFILKFESSVRGIATYLPAYLYISVYTYGRKIFLNNLIRHIPQNTFTPPELSNRILWDIPFRCSLFNAAGMFKSGYGYELAAKQGAGAFLAGTTTALARNGNIKNGIKHPFAPYPNAKASCNWMGLPNEGHEVIAARLNRIERIAQCPVGISIASDPSQTGITALQGVFEGFHLFEKAKVDFIELNESCPNVPHESHSDCRNKLDDELINRLEFISKHFLQKRNRNLPVIVKFSCDTEPELIEQLIDTLLLLGFDGINLGNTSINYDEAGRYIKGSEKRLFDYFTSHFGGGISGAPLKQLSLKLCSIANNYLSTKNPAKEFHIIRTGGIDSASDLIESNGAGIRLNQWFAGYFHNFSKYGDLLYKELFDYGGTCL